jgi:hypothetical protein
MAGISTYAGFERELPGAAALLREVVGEVGRVGKCAELSTIVAWCLRQSGLGAAIVTGELGCSSAPPGFVEAGYHYWTLASEGPRLWHADLANPFLTALWLRENLGEDALRRPVREGDRGPEVPLTEETVVWGTMGAHGIALNRDSVEAAGPFVDVIDEAGRRDFVRDAFRRHGYADPFEFEGNVLDLTGLDVPE